MLIHMNQLLMKKVYTHLLLRIADDEAEEDAKEIEEEEMKKESEQLNYQSDPYYQYYQLNPFDELPEKPKTSIATHKYIKKYLLSIPTTETEVPETQEISKLHIKPKILNQYNELLSKYKPEKQLLNNSLYTLYHSYKDVIFTDRNFKNEKIITLSYTSHILNHIMKNRDILSSHNSDIKYNKYKEDNDNNMEYKDQGFTRPKVLILCPFASYLERIIRYIIQLLPKNIQIMNKKRFFDEFGTANKREEGEGDEEKENKSKAAWEEIFKGNNEDCFRFGLSYNKKQLKLYTSFYSSDIIIASPIGLRLCMGLGGSKKMDIDFLSSIEIVVIDSVDVLKLQNWEHLKDIMNLLNNIPKQDHGVDFSRLRDIYLNGNMKYNRQTLIFSDHLFAEINNLYSNYCFNIRGLYKCKKYQDGVIDNVTVQCRQLFQKLACSKLINQADVRFDYFINKIFPQIKLPDQTHVLIYIPSYFDYIKLRNYFNEYLPHDYCSLHEYLKPESITRSRTWFYNGDKRILLYTGRLYFFRRYKLKKVHYIIFYSPPEHGYMYIYIYILK